MDNTVYFDSLLAINMNVFGY